MNHGCMSKIITVNYEETELGLALIAYSERGLCGLSIGNPSTLYADMTSEFGKFYLNTKSTVISNILHHNYKPILDLGGTEWQRRVWNHIVTIPRGTTQSYAQVSTYLTGKDDSARAVARACAANIIAIAVPCHRVISSSGRISGYRWGVETKRKLLEMEGVNV